MTNKLTCNRTELEYIHDLLLLHRTDDKVGLDTEGLIHHVEITLGLRDRMPPVKFKENTMALPDLKNIVIDFTKELGPLNLQISVVDDSVNIRWVDKNGMEIIAYDPFPTSATITLKMELPAERVLKAGR